MAGKAFPHGRGSVSKIIRGMAPGVLSARNGRLRKIPTGSECGTPARSCPASPGAVLPGHLSVAAGGMPTCRAPRNLQSAAQLVQSTCCAAGSIILLGRVAVAQLLVVTEATVAADAHGVAAGGNAHIALFIGQPSRLVAVGVSERLAHELLALEVNVVTVAARAFDTSNGVVRGTGAKAVLVGKAACPPHGAHRDSFLVGAMEAEVVTIATTAVQTGQKRMGTFLGTVVPGSAFLGEPFAVGFRPR
mmetsp:Transcript_127003/g.359450  ORF Transcript_127003/g.359450 Transcript_127003/m.359450 type:complete len:247 (-) Transcript_127003:232-972(-)